MKIYEKETHEAKYLVVEYEDSLSRLDDKLIGSLDSRCLLKAHLTDPEGMTVHYDISQYETLETYLINRKLSRTEMVGLMAQLKSVIGVLEDHMLSDGNILLDPAHILIDSLNRKVRFIPVHSQEADFTDRLRPLIEAIFLHADLSHVESLYLASELMRVLLKGNVHLHDMMQLIDHRCNEGSYSEQNHYESWDRPNAGAAVQLPGEQSEEINDQVTVLLTGEETTGALQTGELPAGCMTQEMQQPMEKTGIRGLFSGLGDKVKELMEKDE